MEITVRPTGKAIDWNDNAITVSQVALDGCLEDIGYLQIAIHKNDETLETPIATVRLSYDQFVNLANAVRYGLEPEL